MGTCRSKQQYFRFMTYAISELPVAIALFTVCNGRSAMAKNISGNEGGTTGRHDVR